MGEPSYYYNEIDEFAVQWLRNLMDADVIPRGDIDTRSIEDVTPNDVRGYTQCHFFAGIAGWVHALDLAGWPRDRPVWTGSCPCQPFSAAGKGAGFADERHLWPAWQHLIAQCRPPVIFGEQVASKAVDAWIDLVHADMEGMGYAFGSVQFPAAGVGAPHIRDRNYWVGYANDARLEGLGGGHSPEGGRIAAPGSVAAAGADGGMADDTSCGWGEERQDCRWRAVRNCPEGIAAGSGAGGSDLRPSPLHGFWRDADWLFCRDGKWRPVEPGLKPLAHGVSGRVGLLRGYGNAINPHAAAEFIRAFTQAADDLCRPEPDATDLPVAFADLL